MSSVQELIHEQNERDERRRIRHLEARRNVQAHEETQEKIRQQKDNLYFIGLSLGLKTEYSTLCVLEQSADQFRCRHLHRYEIGASAHEVLEDTQNIASKIYGTKILIIDRTGVGDSTIQIFKDSFWDDTLPVDHVVSCSLTAGVRTVKNKGDWYNVPRRDIGSVLAVLMADKRIGIAQSLPNAELFQKELKNFTVARSKKVDENAFDWRNGKNDDLVLCVGVAAWYAGRNVFGDMVTVRTGELVRGG